MKIEFTYHVSVIRYLWDKLMNFPILGTIQLIAYFGFLGMVIAIPFNVSLVGQHASIYMPIMFTAMFIWLTTLIFAMRGGIYWRKQMRVEIDLETDMVTLEGSNKPGTESSSMSRKIIRIREKKNQVELLFRPLVSQLVPKQAMSDEQLKMLLEHFKK